MTDLEWGFLLGAFSLWFIYLCFDAIDAIIEKIKEKKKKND